MTLDVLPLPLFYKTDGFLHANHILFASVVGHVLFTEVPMFRAVHNRCAVDFAKLHLPMSDEEALSLLESINIRPVEIDLIAVARSRVGVSRYRRGARYTEAPDVFDCSSFIKWLYGLLGVWLPRRTIQQISHDSTSIDRHDLMAGDVIYVTGVINYYHDNPLLGVGHVGIATGEGTVIHAANSRVGIVESELSSFLSQETELRGIRRFIKPSPRVKTLEFPLSREIETSDDIRWIVLSHAG